jgi:toxin ParE1/3/4
MAKIEERWTKQALEDLESAREYILENNPSLLASTIDQILSAIEQIKRFPESGRSGRVKLTQELVLTTIPFVIVYRKKKNIIEILAFLHQSRKWP